MLSPVLAGIALAVKLDDGGPVIFRQSRVGRGGRPFTMRKFRTMVVGADRVGLPLTVGADARITRVGAWLRRTKLDELPQLFNVIDGTMSLVGPRPEVPRYVALYTDQQRRVLDLVPGITDPASLSYIDEAAILAEAADPERAYVEHVLPEKLRLNLAYAEQASLSSDVGIIVRTVGAIFRRDRTLR